MNTTKKILGACIAAACLLILSSYTPEPRETTAATTNNNWEEYDKVNEFVWQNICKPMHDSILKEPGKGAVKYFSRCPGGYEPTYVTRQDSVRTGQFVNGKVVFYRGCNPLYVCDFKVWLIKILQW